jgi:hypothetical protein
VTVPMLIKGFLFGYERQLDTSKNLPGERSELVNEGRLVVSACL